MNTYDKVLELIAEQLGLDVKDIKPESEIVKDLGADSLDVVQMLMTMEEEFSITVPEEDAGNLRTVKDIVDLIEKTQK